MVQLLKDSQSLDICPTWDGCSLMGQLLKDTQCQVLWQLRFRSNLEQLQLNGATTKRYSVPGHLVVELVMVAAEWGNYKNILSAGTLVQLDMVAPECGNH
jgi:hypothetical protein